MDILQHPLKNIFDSELLSPALTPSSYSTMPDIGRTIVYSVEYIAYI